MGRRPANRFSKLLKFQDRRRTDDSKATVTPVLELEDSEVMLTSTSTKMDTDRSEESACSLKSVRFGDCAVRSYSQVLGDHPYCSVGCPLELGWDFESLERITVDEYESLRSERGHRSSGELKLSPQERRAILQEFPDAEIRKACRRRNRNHKRVQKEFFASV